jgi:hypothetical protein
MTRGKLPGALAHLTQRARRYRRMRSAAAFLSQWTRASLPGCVALLTVAFLARVLWPPLIWALACIPAWAGIVAVWLARRPGDWAVPTWQSLAVADVRSANSGLLMALAEAPSEDWAPEVRRPDTRLPVAYPRGTALLWAVVAGATLGILLTPDLRPKVAKPPDPMRPVEATQELLTAIQEHDLLEKEYLEDVDRMLERIREETTTSLSAADWQALDTARAEIERRLAAEQETLAETAGRLEALRQKVAEAAKKAAATGPAASNGALPPELTQGLSEALEGLDPDLLAGLDPQALQDMLDRLENGEPFDGDALQDLMGMLGDACDKAGEKEGFCEGLGGMCPGNAPGRGGVNRGPGEAPVRGTGNTNPDFGGFDPKQFGARGAKPDVPLGFAFAPPSKPETTAPTGRPGPAVQFGPGNQRLTWRSRLLPSHTTTIRRYFDTNE